jgi:hypothetical protein
MGTERTQLPRLHGFDHGRKGPDPARLAIDSTETASLTRYDQGVHAEGASIGDVLTALDVDGNTGWRTQSSPVTEFPSAGTGSVAGSGGTANMTWGTPVSTLVDYTDPFNPAIIADGIYSLSGGWFLNVGDNVSAGKVIFAFIAFILGTTVTSQGAYTAGGAGGAPGFGPLALTAFLPAGTVLVGGAQNYDTVAHTFFFAGALQLIR